jgi:hypothetical protein
MVGFRAFHAPTSLAATLLVFFAGQGVSSAAEPGSSTAPELSRKENLATVRVSLPAGGRSPTVAVIRRHGSTDLPIEPDAFWFGVCLPDRILLKTWRERGPRDPHRRLWTRALQRQRYEALVVLAMIGDSARPSCYGLADGMSMKFTDLHPDYRTYVENALAGKLPKPRPTLFVAPLHE